MKTIYKYPVNINRCGGLEKISIPRSADIISFDRDCYGEYCIWAIVDKEEIEKREIVVAAIGTGWDLSFFDNFEKVEFIKTIQEPPFIWHIFIAE